MNRTQNTATISALIIICIALPESSAEEFAKLPEGDKGIAAGYPGDRGIDQAPGVVFADDFEDYSTVADLRNKWDVVTHEAQLSLDVIPQNSDGGRQTLKMTIPQRQNSLATGIGKSLAQTQDRLFLRWYVKFDAGWFVPKGSVHNGGSISSKYFVNDVATPGVPADGRNKFLVNFENDNNNGDPPGHMNVYIYWPEQGDRFGDHFYPSGKVLPFSKARSGAATFGEQFQARRDFSPKRDRWYCYEHMVQANTPSKRDGRVALWVDGKLIADFTNLRLRDTGDLRIDRIKLGLYIARNTERANHKWIDNVVAATSYIGPVMRAE